MLLLVTFLACQPALPACDDLCARAADAFGGCLTGWGLGWDAAGFDDRDDYVDACGTWAWEERQIAGDDAVSAVCEQRAKALADGTCEAYQSIDWNEPVEAPGEARAGQEERDLP